MRLWRTRLVVASSVLGIAVSASLLGVTDAHAQGCVASRMNAPSSPTDQTGNEYYLKDGKWQASFGYRNFMSHRHFVGENPPSAATATRPAVPPVYTDGNGIGDLTLLARYWVANPTQHSNQNISVGLGFKLPTGKDDINGTFKRVVNNTLQDWVHPVDQSIQPGDGGFGYIAELQAFKSFGSVTAFLSGGYLFNPKGTNGVQTGRSNPNEAIMSVADQFGARVGVGMPLRFAKGLAVSLGARLEGVPSSDVFGSSAGFRRPGYSVGIEPGVSYSWKSTAFSFSVPYLVYRNRTQSYADKLATVATGTFVNGDAAFADYIFIAGFTKRF